MVLLKNSAKLRSSPGWNFLNANMSLTKNDPALRMSVGVSLYNVT